MAETPMGFPRGEPQRVREILPTEAEMESLKRSMERTIMSDEMSPASVERGGVCAACPTLQAKVATIETRQLLVIKTLDENRGTLQEIFGLLRDANGKAAQTHEEVVVLEEKAKHAALNAATKRSAWMIVAGLFAREAIKRVFGF